MSVSDELMWKYWTLLTDLRSSEIAAMQAEVAAGKLHPMQAKKNLAWGIVRDFHSAAAADTRRRTGRTVSAARRDRRRAGGEDLAGAEGLAVELGLRRVRCALAEAAAAAGLASSTGEATRKLGENCGQRRRRKVQRKIVEGRERRQLGCVAPGQEERARGVGQVS